MWSKIASAVAGPIVSGAFGLMNRSANNRRQLEQQQKLQDQQIKGAKEMTDYQKETQMDIWNKTNYGAQVEHLKKAGLNPGLMYGMSGGGGATTGSAGGSAMPTGGQAPQGGGEMEHASGNAMQLALMGAQKAVLESQANKNNVEAEKIGGVDTVKTTAETGNIAEATKLIGQKIQSEEVAREGLRLQNTFDGIRNSIQENTSDDQIREIKAGAIRAEYEVDRILEEIESRKIENSIKRETKQSVIDTYNLNVKNLQKDLLVKNSQIGVNEAQAINLIEQINNKVTELNLTAVKNRQEYESKITQIEASLQISQRAKEASIESSKNIKSGMENSAMIGAGGRIIQQVIDLGTKIKPFPIKGFGGK